MKTMTKEQLAELLNGNEYRDEMTKEQEQAAEENNLLVLFGASDDLLEMRGAIYDEAGAYDGGEYALALDGELYADGEEENTYHKAIGNEILPLSDEYDNDDNPRLIRAEWCPDDQLELSWRISSNMPYAPFTIKRDGEPYCEGIVIDIDDSGVYLGEKGVYLNLTAVEMREQRYGDTHVLKQSLSKEIYQAMSEEERMAQPIVGALKPIESQQRQMEVTQTTNAAEAVEDPDDLPF